MIKHHMNTISWRPFPQIAPVAVRGPGARTALGAGSADLGGDAQGGGATQSDGSRVSSKIVRFTGYD